jgi:dienelactone hydrolase
MKARQGESDTMLTLVVYPRAPHTFDMRLPDRTVLGMQLGYDAEATSDARRRVIEFLSKHDVGTKTESRRTDDRRQEYG